MGIWLWNAKEFPPTNFLSNLADKASNKPAISSNKSRHVLSLKKGNITSVQKGRRGYYLRVNYESESLTGTKANASCTSEAGRWDSCLMYLEYIKDRGCNPKITMQGWNRVALHTSSSVVEAKPSHYRRPCHKPRVYWNFTPNLLSSDPLYSTSVAPVVGRAQETL